MEILHTFFDNKNENMFSFLRRGFLFYCTYHPWEENLMYLDSILWPSWRTEMLSSKAWRNYWDKKLDRDRNCDIEINVIIWNWIFVATATAVTLGVWRSHLQICETHQSLVPSKGLNSFQDGLYVDVITSPSTHEGSMFTQEWDDKADSWRDPP